jgi:uncharacterized protein YndB with AHSA1/START domain
METEPVIVKRSYSASEETVWRAITDLEQMRQWYFPMLGEFEPEPGFETRFDVQHGGKVFVHIWKIKEVVPLKKISYEWRFGGYPGDSVVSWELFPEPGGTRIMLTHSGIETFDGDNNPDLAKHNFIAGWTDFVGNKLKAFVEKEADFEN